MFEWLFNRKVVTPETPKSVRGNISLLIIMEMEQYIQENQEIVTNVSLDDNGYRQLSLAYNELLSAGLSNTKNARLIKKRMDAMVESSERIVKANKLLKFAKDLRTHFGETTLLIGTAQFEKLCMKYNLSVGTINQYTGTIPDKNFRELQKALTKAKSFQNELNIKSGSYIYFVNGVECYSSVEDDSEVYQAKEWIRKNRFISAERILRADDTLSLNDIVNCNPDMPISLRVYDYKNLIQFRCSPVTKGTMFIACPPDQLKVEPLKITTKAVDPIVFQYSPYGIVIHTMWGEESEDAVIEEYKRLNNLMNL